MFHVTAFAVKLIQQSIKVRQAQLWQIAAPLHENPRIGFVSADFVVPGVPECIANMKYEGLPKLREG